MKSVAGWTRSHASTGGSGHASLFRPCGSLLNCSRCPMITARSLFEVGTSPRVTLTFLINPSPVRTLAFEPLGHLPISIPEMAN